MPRGNQFRHQVYQSERPTSPYHLIPKVTPTNPESASYRNTLNRAGQVFGRENLKAIFCVHGTFASLDPTGLVLELGRYSPEMSNRLIQLGKWIVDLVMDESGNFTPRFAQSLSEHLSSGAGYSVPVALFNWSGQNNHVGRADAAVRLIHRLAQFAESKCGSQSATDRPPRVMLWGHSHGGNALAIVTNLLGADQQTRDEFFSVSEPFYTTWSGSHCCFPEWSEVAEILQDPTHPLRQLRLDIVTFGTPIRYGWDANGYANLLHVVHHRPQAGREAYQAAWPILPWRVLTAADGDYLQHVGIARTNLMPFPLALRALISDLRLHRLLQRELDFQWWLTRVKHGTRVADEGTTLLVDYASDGLTPLIFQHLAGHALYTRRRWLPFHCSQIAKHFYGEVI